MNHVNENIKLSGWVHRIRKLKAVVFIILRDRTGLIQLAVPPKLFEENELKLESVISVEGTVVENKNKLGPVEIQVTEIRVLSTVTEEMPIQINGESMTVGLDTLLNHRVLSLRHPKEAAIFKIQAALGESFAAYLRQQDFMEVHTPKLVKEGAEGGSNVFSLEYFGETAYLAQSPQFYKQMMVASGAERVFEVGSVFRAETHSTSRHLNEYVSLDLEVGFIENEIELMLLETELLRYMLNHVNQTCNHALEILGILLPAIPPEIPTLKLSEAIKILKEQYGKNELEGDLDPESEKMIAEHIFNETGSEFLFLTHYPQSKRPMYTMPTGETETQSFDLLFRGLEITTGGMRIHEMEMLIQSMLKKGLNPEHYTAYIETFKYGAPPHGGLAIGLERLTAQLLGFSNVRRTSLFPRDCNRLTP